jgi:hypothetical protein
MKQTFQKRSVLEVSVIERIDLVAWKTRAGKIKTVVCLFLLQAFQYYINRLNKTPRLLYLWKSINVVSKVRVWIWKFSALEGKANQN